MTPLLRSMGLVLTASVVGSFGAVFLKLGATQTTRSLLSFLNWRLTAGVALFLASSAFYVMGIRGGQLSVLYPVVALGYIWTVLWARIFFGEPLTARKFAGLGLIMLGVALVGFGI